MEFAVAADGDGAAVGLAGVGGSEDESDVGAGLGDGSGEPIAGQRMADRSELGQLEVVGWQCGQRLSVVRVEELDGGCDEAAFAGVGIADGPDSQVTSPREVMVSSVRAWRALLIRR